MPEIMSCFYIIFLERASNISNDLVKQAHIVKVQIQCCFYMIILYNNYKKFNLGSNKASFLCILWLNVNLNNKSEDGKNKERRAAATMILQLLNFCASSGRFLYPSLLWKVSILKQWKKWRHKALGLLFLLKITCLYLEHPSSLAGNTWGCVNNRTFTEKIIKPIPKEIIYFPGR